MTLAHIEKVPGGYIVAYHAEKPNVAEMQQVMKTGEFPANLMRSLFATMSKPNEPLKKVCSEFSEVIEFLKELFGEP